MELTTIPPDKVIMQHNMITSGRYDFTACQLDILFLLLALLQKEDAPNKAYDLYVKDIETITGRQWNHQRLIEATEDMGGRMFVVETPQSYKQIWLFGGFEYIMGKGYFTAHISELARPYFFELKNNFTSLQLRAVLSCSSKYAKRLYGLACQWRTAGKVTMDICALKEMLGLRDPKGKQKEQFAKISQFQSYVLDIAKRQINEHTDVKFDYQLHKRGRSFERITLYIDFQKEQQMTIDFKDPVEFQKNVKTLTAYGVSEEMARTIAKKHFPAFLDLRAKMLASKTPIEDPGAYIMNAFQKNGVVHVPV